MRPTLALAWMLILVGAQCAGAATLEERYFHRNWRPAEGLPGNSVYAVAQSSDRYIWIGTEGGLARFDGRRFIAFGNRENGRLPGVFVTALLAAQDDTLWVGTERGLLRLRPADLVGGRAGSRPWSMVEEAPVSALAQDARGGLWIGTRSGLLSRSAEVSAAAGVPVLQKVGLAGIRVTQLLAGAPGELWIGTEAHGLWYLRDGKLAAVGGPRQARDTVTVLVRDDGGTDDVSPALASPSDAAAAEAGAAVLAFTADGCRRYVAGRPAGGTIAAGVRHVVAAGGAPGGGLWLATTDHGLILFKDGRRYGTSVDHPLIDAVISNVFVAADHTVWLGSGGDGLHQLIEKSCLAYTSHDGLASTRAESVLLDRDGALHVGTQQGLTTLALGGRDDVAGSGAGRADDDGHGRRGGSRRSDAGGAMQARTDLRGTEVLALRRDRRGILWAGTARGVARRIDGRWRFLAPWTPLGAPTVNVMLEDTAGNFWIGSTAGLAVIPATPANAGADGAGAGLPPLGSPYKAAERVPGLAAHDGGAASTTLASSPTPRMVLGLEDAEVIDLSQADDGALWIGTRGAGLLRLAAGKLETVRSATELPIVNLVWRGRAGDLWVGTFGGGLQHLRQGHWYRFDEANGLPDATIRQMLEDRQGDLWLCSGAGISRISRRAIAAVETGTAPGLVAFTYGPEDGVPEGTCYGGSHPGAALGGDGHMWFSMAHGVVEIRPERMAQLDVGSKPALDVVVVNGRELAPSPAHRMQIAGGSRRLDLRFSAPLFVARRRGQVRYRLAGFDHEWTLDGGDRVARYTNLPPASYAFEVAIADGRGGWRAPVSLTAIEILPLFYQRLGFWALVGLGLAALAIAVYRLAARRLLARAAALTHQVEQRTEELRQVNSRLQQLAAIDPLTGLANRRRLQEALDLESRRSARYQSELSLILLDVDFFKGFNDLLGHVSGDDCLRQVAASLQGVAMRSGDVVARYGGEEFAVLLPGTPAMHAYGIAETIRQRVMELAIRHPGSSVSSCVTISAGVASVIPAAGFDPVLLVESADSALYRAKRDGRNRVLIGARGVIDTAAAMRPLRLAQQQPPAAA